MHALPKRLSPPLKRTATNKTYGQLLLKEHVVRRAYSLLDHAGRSAVESSNNLFVCGQLRERASPATAFWWPQPGPGKPAFKG